MNTFLQLDDIRISWLNGGDFELDGGTMFGAVPRALWQKKYPPDDENYIQMRNTPLLVQTKEHNILIDTGLGNKFTEKQKKLFRINRAWSLPEELEKLGLERKDIDIVILTHCDFDHAGGVVMRNEQDVSELTFPRARHIVQQKEWHDVLHPNIRSRHTYWPDNFAGLEQSGLLERIDGTAEISGGITVQHTGGHTRGYQLVEIQGSEGACAVHLGDLLPTHAHTNPLWIMAYDNFPMEVIEIKQQLIPHYRQRNCWFTFYHDWYMKACRLDEKGNLIEEIGDF